MKTRLYITVISVLLLAGACGKTSYDEAAPAYASISFFNASYTLDNFLPASGSDREVRLSLAGQRTAVFSATAGYRQDFPDINWRNNAPWIVFDHYSPGTYTGNILLRTPDSVSGSQFSFPVNIEKDHQYTWCLSDSLGTFHATTVTHTRATAAGTVRLRLVQLCPDADSVNMRIGAQLLKGIQNLPYRSVSGYVEYPLPTDSTLKLRLFNARDTLTTIARADLPATPGQVYLLILRNYSKNHQYKNNTGQLVNVIPNGVLDIRKVE